MNQTGRIRAARLAMSYRSAFFAAPLLLLLTSGAFAQSRAPSVFAASHSELRQYLQQKYFTARVDVQPKEHHLYGDTRTLWVDGVLTPPSVAGLRASTRNEARLIAQAFFSEEAALLGLTPVSEMREMDSPRTSQWGFTVIAYRHYVAG